LINNAGRVSDKENALALLKEGKKKSNWNTLPLHVGSCVPSITPSTFADCLTAKEAIVYPQSYPPLLCSWNPPRLPPPPILMICSVGMGTLTKIFNIYSTPPIRPILSSIGQRNLSKLSMWLALYFHIWHFVVLFRTCFGCWFRWKKARVGRGKQLIMLILFVEPFEDVISTSTLSLLLSCTPARPTRSPPLRSGPPKKLT
jgi:hypothetical protein